MTHWPPLPEARMTSILTSLSGMSIWMSSSTSAITATVMVEVWMRPPDSVAGTLWTLWTPDSYLSLDQAPRPEIMKFTYFMPPMPISS